MGNSWGWLQQQLCHGAGEGRVAQAAAPTALVVGVKGVKLQDSCWLSPLATINIKNLIRLLLET